MLHKATNRFLFAARILIAVGMIAFVSTALADDKAKSKRPSHILESGQKLRVGQSLVSQDSRFALHLQPDGNLVLYFYQRSPQKILPVWATGTDSFGKDAYIYMDPDGIPKIYNSDGREFPFATHLNPTPGSRFILQNNGDLVLYRKGPTGPRNAAWHTETYADADNTTRFVIPNALSVELNNANIGAGGQLIINETDALIGVHNGNEFTAVSPNTSIEFVPTGKLNIKASIYSYDHANPDAVSADAISDPIIYTPGKNIVVKKRGKDFALTLR